jgi:hypothetical protein
LLKNKEENNLLFILSLSTEMTLLGYVNERIEIYDMPIHKFFIYKGAIKQKGYKAAIKIDGLYLYPTTGIQNPDCCWLHIDVMCGKHILGYIKFLQKYHPSISTEQILQMYMRMIKHKEALSKTCK